MLASFTCRARRATNSISEASSNGGSLSGSSTSESLKRLVDAGATVLPAMPGFYHTPRTIQDLIDFIVGRICDHLGIEHKLFKRWGESAD